MDRKKQKEIWAKYYARNKESEAARKKIWYINNKKKIAIVQKKWRIKNLESIKSRCLERKQIIEKLRAKRYFDKYGKSGKGNCFYYKGVYRRLDKQDYDTEYEKQDGKCLICKKKTKLLQDHCHKLEIFRGLLCVKCNIGLGQFNDNVKTLKSAIVYLENNLQK